MIHHRAKLDSTEKTL